MSKQSRPYARRTAVVSTARRVLLWLEQYSEDPTIQNFESVELEYLRLAEFMRAEREEWDRIASAR